MKKKMIAVILMCLCMMMSACNADDINNAVNKAGEEMGVDINLNLEQEQVDAVVDKVEEVKDGVVNVVTDQEVKDAASGLLDAIKDAATDKSSSEKTESETK